MWSFSLVYLHAVACLLLVPSSMAVPNCTTELTDPADRPHMQCGSTGTLKHPDYYPNLRQAGTTSLDTCRFTCSVRSDCSAFSFDSATGTCDFYKKRPFYMGFQEDPAATTGFYHRKCFRPSPVRPGCRSQFEIGTTNHSTPVNQAYFAVDPDTSTIQIYDGDAPIYPFVIGGERHVTSLEGDRLYATLRSPEHNAYKIDPGPSGDSAVSCVMSNMGVSSFARIFNCTTRAGRVKNNYACVGINGANPVDKTGWWIAESNPQDGETFACYLMYLVAAYWAPPTGV